MVIISPLLCAVQIHYNHGNGGSALIFVCCIYGMGVVLALNEQRVRLHCSNLNVLLVFNYKAIVSLSSYAVQIHYNGDG